MCGLELDLQERFCLIVSSAPIQTVAVVWPARNCIIF